VQEDVGQNTDTDPMVLEDKFLFGIVVTITTGFHFATKKGRHVCYKSQIRSSISVCTETRHQPTLSKWV